MSGIATTPQYSADSWDLYASPAMLRYPAAALVAALALLATGCADSDPAPTTAPPPAPGTSEPLRAAAASSTTTTVPATTAPTTATTTTSVPTTTTTTTTLPPLVIGFAGDTSFTHGNAGADPLAAVADELAAPDLMVVNLETAVAEAGVGRAANKRFVFKSPPESVGLLTAAGIDAVQLANNHTLDYGPAAVDRTLTLLDEGGVLYVGGGRDENASYQPLLVEVAGRTVGIAAFSRVPCDWSASGVNSRPEIAWTCPPFAERARQVVADMAAAVDVAVVMAHGGTEGVRCPEDYRMDLTAGWVEAGADAVVWSHPHVLQGVERVGDAWVLYSTGNFAFPSARGATAETALFTLTFDGPESRLRAIPMLGPGGRLRPAGPGETARILELLSRISFGVTFDEYGEAIPADPGGDCGPGLGG